MKVVICNMGYSGYWIACWRELLKRVDLRVLTPETKYPYPPELLKALPITVLDDATMASSEAVAARVLAERPDVLVVSGWASPAFKALAFDARLKDLPKVMIVDTAWNGSLRQILSRFRLRSYVRRFAGIIVGGRRGRTFARWIGFRPEQIFRSIYGYDADAFASCAETRAALGDWPRRFCFVGRYAPVKGISTLLDAYARYRESVSDPWELHCYGTGPLKDQMASVSGVVDHGFVSPADLPAALAHEGAFVFPSLHEPWGVALAEAAGAGLPIICSDQVASGDDLVRNGENGLVVKAGDAAALADALATMHGRYAALPAMGERSLALAKDFAPLAWADRWMEVFHALGW